MTVRLAMVFVLLGARLASADPEEPKHEGVALALSAGGAAASIGLFAAGLSIAGGPAGNSGYTIATIGLASTLITPSFGEWYAGKYWTAGMGLRLAGTAVTIAGLSQLQICFDECSPHDNSAAAALLGLGLVSYAAGMVWDIAAAPSTARESNARHRAVITPSVLTTPSGAAAYGLGLGGRF